MNRTNQAAGKRIQPLTPETLRSYISRLPLSEPEINELMVAATVQAKEILNAQRRRSVPAQFLKYQNDPAGFGTEVLGEEFTDDVLRVMESVRDNPITIARSANATGKTHAAARIGAWFYKCFEGAQVYTGAAPPKSNLRRILWGEIGKMVGRNPNVFSTDTLNVMNIHRSESEFFVGVTIPQSGTPEEREARFSGKHAPYLLFIIDEGDAVPDEVYRGIESCMSGGVARLLIMFNPRGKQGKVWQMERDGEASVVELTAFNHPNVITGKELYPGAVTREKTLQRIHEWTRPLLRDEEITRNCFQVPDYMVGAQCRSTSGVLYPPLQAGWRAIVTPEFSYMVLALYPAMSTTQLIDEEWVIAARSRWDAYVARYGERPPHGVRAILGVDVGEYGTDNSVALRRYGGWVAMPNFWQGVDVTVTGEKVAEIFREHPIYKCFIDATGVGSGVAGTVTKELRRRPPANSRNRPGRGTINAVKVAEAPTETEAKIGGQKIGEFLSLRDQIWWAVREWLRTDPYAMLPPIEFLAEELTIPTYEKTPKGRIKVMNKQTMRRKLGRSPDFADALCLTFAPAKRDVRVDFI